MFSNLSQCYLADAYLVLYTGQLVAAEISLNFFVQLRAVYLGFVVCALPASTLATLFPLHTGLKHCSPHVPPF